MKKIIRLEIKPIQFGYVVRVLEQSHFENEFGINGSCSFRPPGYQRRDEETLLVLRSAGYQGADEFSFWVRGAPSAGYLKHNVPVAILHKSSNTTHFIGYRCPAVGGGRRWCKQYVSKLERAVRLYNNYDW